VIVESRTGWHRTPLRQLLEERNVRVADLPEAEREDLEVLSLTKGYGLIPQSERFAQRVATENVDRYKILRPGWIVYNPYVIWEGAIHSLKRPDPGVVSPVYVVWCRVEDDKGFLDYVLRTPEVVSAYEGLSAGAVNRRRSIKKTDFLDIEILCPPLDEQRRIAALLNHVKALCSLHEQVLSRAEELKGTLVNRLLTTGLRGEPTVETELGRLPGSWTVAPLGKYIADSKYGLGDKGGATGAFPLLRMTNQKHGRIVADDLQYIDLSAAQFERFRLQPRDVLFNRTNSHELVGRTAIFDLAGDYVFASYLIRLRPDRDRLRPEFLNHTSAGRKHSSGSRASRAELSGRATSARAGWPASRSGFPRSMSRTQSRRRSIRRFQRSRFVAAKSRP